MLTVKSCLQLSTNKWFHSTIDWRKKETKRGGINNRRKKFLRHRQSGRRERERLSKYFYYYEPDHLIFLFFHVVGPLIECENMRKKKLILIKFQDEWIDELMRTENFFYGFGWPSVGPSFYWDKLMTRLSVKVQRKAGLGQSRYIKIDEFQLGWLC